MFENQIIYAKNRLSLFAEYKKVEEHKHFAKHILVADQPFVCTVENKKYVLPAAFIQSNTKHSFEYSGSSPVFMMLIDESSELSDNIDTVYLKEKSIAALPPDVYRGALTYVFNRKLKELDAFLIDMLFDVKTDKKMDARIKKVLDFIDTTESLDSDLFKKMTTQAVLSESRFSHLFKSEVGVDFKNYVLLKKIEKTFNYVLQENMSITTACIKAGFSGSSHFSTACKSHFGISFRDFITSQKYT